MVESQTMDSRSWWGMVRYSHLPYAREYSTPYLKRAAHSQRQKIPEDRQGIRQSLVRLSTSQMLSASCRSKSIKPCGSLRPFSEPSTTTPQKNTRLVTCVSDELLLVGFQSSPVASGTTLRGEWLSAMYCDRLFRAVAGWICSKGPRVERRRDGVEEKRLQRLCSCLR
jgi:hypothetical protein